MAASSPPPDKEVARKARDKTQDTGVSKEYKMSAGSNIEHNNNGYTTSDRKAKKRVKMKWAMMGTVDGGGRCRRINNSRRAHEHFVRARQPPQNL
jgi:hypothetical protein